jgi:drug/metabolite transporter (DMT)-like permease
MPTRTPVMSGIAWVLLLTLSVLWGATFFFWKVLVEYLPPFTAVFGRVGNAALVLVLVLALRRETLPLTRAAWRRFAIMAALNNAIPFALIAYGETAIASGLASILNAATPLFTVPVAHVLTDDEKLTPLRILGIALGFLYWWGRTCWAGLLPICWPRQPACSRRLPTPSPAFTGGGSAASPH